MYAAAQAAAGAATARADAMAPHHHRLAALQHLSAAAFASQYDSLTTMLDYMGRSPVIRDDREASMFRAHTPTSPPYYPTSPGYVPARSPRIPPAPRSPDHSPPRDAFRHVVYPVRANAHSMRVRGIQPTHLQSGRTRAFRPWSRSGTAAAQAAEQQPRNEGVPPLTSMVTVMETDMLDQRHGNASTSGPRSASDLMARPGRTQHWTGADVGVAAHRSLPIDREGMTSGRRSTSDAARSARRAALLGAVRTTMHGDASDDSRLVRPAQSGSQDPQLHQPSTADVTPLFTSLVASGSNSRPAARTNSRDRAESSTTAAARRMQTSWWPGPTTQLPQPNLSPMDVPTAAAAAAGDSATTRLRRQQDRPSLQGPLVRQQLTCTTAEPSHVPLPVAARPSLASERPLNSTAPQVVSTGARHPTRQPDADTEDDAFLQTLMDDIDNSDGPLSTAGVGAGSQQQQQQPAQANTLPAPPALPNEGPVLTPQSAPNIQTALARQQTVHAVRAPADAVRAPAHEMSSASAFRQAVRQQLYMDMRRTRAARDRIVNRARSRHAVGNAGSGAARLQLESPGVTPGDGVPHRPAAAHMPDLGGAATADTNAWPAAAEVPQERGYRAMQQALQGPATMIAQGLEDVTATRTPHNARANRCATGVIGDWLG